MELALVWAWAWVMELVLAWVMELAWKSGRYKTLHSTGHFQRQLHRKRLQQRSRCFR
jgi:predicted metal-dependent HD superfamily phosphohydrolase